MKFEPRCCVCKEKISNPEEGMIGCDHYARKLPWLASEYLRDEELVEGNKQKWIESVASDICSGEHSQFVNAVTFQYFQQFKDLYWPNGEGISNLTEIIQDKIAIERGHELRARMVLNTENNKSVVMPLHYSCFPEIVGCTYQIGLERIMNPEAALEWSFHLNEKNWFNPGGWLDIIEGIFGRGSTT